MRMLVSVALASLFTALPLRAGALDVGDAAPPFEAESTMGTIRLSDYLGKKHVLLAFYYQDFTGG